MGRMKDDMRAAGACFSRFLLKLGVLALVPILSMMLTMPSAMAEKKKQGAHVYHLSTDSDRISMRVTLHKSETVKVDFPFSEALVGSPEVADIVPLTNKSVYILGKKIGVTRLSLLDTQKQVLGIVDIEVSHDVDALKATLNEDPAFRKIKLRTVNGKILMTGQVPDGPTAHRAMTLAEQIAPGDVTNGMSVSSPQQVMLEVRFIEADRTVGRGLGVNWMVHGNRVGVGGVTGVETVKPGTGFSSNQDGISSDAVMSISGGLASNAIPFGTAIGRVLDGGIKADVVVRALEERGLARRLAEPNLVALSGQPANFLAGGEFPFPVAADNGKITTSFKKFGIGLAFTPTVLNDGQISLVIEPEVSEIDMGSGVKIGDITVPGLSVRRAQTTVELRDGQSFAIAGLLSNTHVSDERQLPWIGNVPVLGALFRSASFQKSETDLVIIVTPRLVKPRIPGQKLATPLDRSVPGNDADMFLLGRQEVEVNRPRQNQGHIIDYNQQGDVPASGKDER